MANAPPSCVPISHSADEDMELHCAESWGSPCRHSLGLRLPLPHSLPGSPFLPSWDSCPTLRPALQPPACLLCRCLITQLCPTIWWSRGLDPSSLLCPWNFPGKNTWVGCHLLLQGIFLTKGSNPRLPHWQADSLPSHHLGCLPPCPLFIYPSFLLLSPCPLRFNFHFGGRDGGEFSEESGPE